MQLTLDGRPLDTLSIETLQMYAPKDGTPYRVAYSGGKDSCVILDLVKRSGLPFYAVYRFVPIDPPELRKFIFEQAKDQSNHLSIQMPSRSLISEARQRGIMPLRNKRWCCQMLKETTMNGETVVTGIRRVESSKRSKRQMVEPCRNVDAWFVHPILDWEHSHVWDYIRERNLQYCHLYDEGWKRLGCVLCPMNRDVQRHMARWPQIARIWKAINDAVWQTRQTRIFDTSEKQWAWWLNRDASADPDESCPLFDGELS